MRDEIPMHDSVHWPVEDEEDEFKPPSKKRYLVTAAIESIVLCEIEARTEAEAIATFTQHAESFTSVTIWRQHSLTVKRASAIAL